MARPRSGSLIPGFDQRTQSSQCLVSQADRSGRDSRLDLANYFGVVGGIEVEACLGDHLPKAKPKVKLGIAFDFEEIQGSRQPSVFISSFLMNVSAPDSNTHRMLSIQPYESYSTGNV